MFFSLGLFPAFLTVLEFWRRSLVASGREHLGESHGLSQILQKLNLQVNKVSILIQLYTKFRFIVVIRLTYYDILRYFFLSPLFTLKYNLCIEKHKTYSLKNNYEPSLQEKEHCQPNPLLKYSHTLGL